MEGDAALAAAPGVARRAPQRRAAPRHGGPVRAPPPAAARSPPVGPAHWPPPRHWSAGPRPHWARRRERGAARANRERRRAQPVASGDPERQWEPRLPALFIARPAAPAVSPAAAAPCGPCSARPAHRPRSCAPAAVRRWVRGCRPPAVEAG